jgi:hypothetical protein
VRLTRRMTVGLLAASATPWALLLSVGGLWLCTIGAERWPAMSGPCRLGGIASVAAGQLVFACLVADRFFPGADRRLVGWVEILTSTSLLIAVMLVLARVCWLWIGVST